MSAKNGMFFCWSSWHSRGLAVFGSKGSRSGRVKPCLILPSRRECRTCFEVTGSLIDWYSSRAESKFSRPHFSRHFPKTIASNIDMFVLLRPWGVVGWAASPINTTLFQKIWFKGSQSYIAFMKGSFVSFMTLTNSGSQTCSASCCIFFIMPLSTLMVTEFPCTYFPIRNYQKQLVRIQFMERNKCRSVISCFHINTEH